MTSSRKTFNHNLVEEIKLPRDESSGKRFYVLPDGTRLRSVTSVLDEKSDKTHLEAWRKRIGHAEANKITTTAARRGTALHKVAERYVLNEDAYLEGANPFAQLSFLPIKRMLDESVDNIYGIELPLFSRALEAAGTADLIAEYNGVPSIIDFKTARKPKKEEWIQNYFLQATTYSLMFQQMYKVDIPQIVLMFAVENENPQLFVKSRGPYIEKVIEVFTT